MKTYFFAILGLLVMGLSSCSKKQHRQKNKHQDLPLITSEQQLQLKAGESITISLPKENTDDAYMVTKQSSIGANGISNKFSYTYTAPTVIPVGVTTDEVELSNQHSKLLFHHGGCFGSAKDNYGKEASDQHYVVKLHIQFVNSGILESRSVK